MEQAEELPQPDPNAIPDVKLALGEGIRTRLRELYSSQQAAAQALGMELRNLNPLFVGKMDRYSLAWLIMTASRVGLNVLIALQQPRLTAGEPSRNDRRGLAGHDPPRVGGVRSIEHRHGPPIRAPSG